MADELKVEIQGLDEVVDALRQIGVDAVAAVELIALAAAEPVAQAVAAKAPGRIGEDIVTETTTKSKKRVTVSIGPSRAAWYARFVEYGTASGGEKILTRKKKKGGGGKPFRLYGISSNMLRASINHQGIAAQPFMRPAFDTTQQAAQQRAAAAAKKAVGAD